MNNEWFFKWHHIGGTNTVTMDGFDGRTISFNNLAFSGSCREAYWNALARYLRNKVSENYDKAENELKSFPASLRIAVIAETKSITDFHARRILRTALEKDRILRGDGIQFPPQDEPRAQVIQLNIDERIRQRDHALKEFHQIDNRFRRFDDLLGEYPNIIKLALGFGVGSVFTLLISKLLSF